MTVETVRALTNDKAQPDRAVLAGDGFSVDFALPNSPVVSSSYRVYSGSTPQAEITHYTIDRDSGVITFVAAPASGAVITVNYRHTILSDADIEAFLSLEGDVAQLAAATALETIATNQALTLKVMKLLDVQTDGAKLASELRARAAVLRQRAEEDGGFDIAETVPNAFAYRERVTKQAMRGVL